jgi:solute carrier family 25 protein 38
MGRREDNAEPSTLGRRQKDSSEAAGSEASGSKDKPDGDKQGPTQQSAARKRPPAIASALSGALSGALISACVQPLDVLRTRMQADASKGVFR